MNIPLKTITSCSLTIKLASFNRHRSLGKSAIRSSSSTASYEEALKGYKQAIHFEPTPVKAFGYMGNVLCILKRYNDALIANERALQLDPNELLSIITKRDY